jgi:hypothetical protein
MLISWLDAREAKAFGEALAKYFMASAPDAACYGDKAFEMKSSKVFRHMAEQVASFKLQHKLNTFKKAQLGNTFHWHLMDAGLDRRYVDKLTQWLMLELR